MPCENTETTIHAFPISITVCELEDRYKMSKTSSSSSNYSTSSGSSFHGTEEKIPEFKGFRDPYNFQTCVAVAVSSGVVGVLLSIFPSFITSSLTLFASIAIYTWFRLYGINMTRKEVIFFVVRNLLEIAPNFEYETGRVSEDCATPGDGTAEKPPSGPQSIWDALFADEGKIKMAQFYRDHYGPVYKRGKREYEEYKKQKEAAENMPPSSSS